MSSRISSSRSQDDTDADRLRRLLATDALSLDVVSAIAGDRPLTEAEKEFLDEQKTRRADQFFSDILYVVAHQHFPPEVAEKLWNEVLRHKYEMSEALKRNVRVVVAALDYLSNFRRELISTTLIGEAHIAEIANLSMHDGLTGLFNHTSCFELIEVELKLHERYKTAVSLLMLDIDNFKNVNDRQSHQEGDRILAELAAVLRRETRVSDICCRYGGDEFAVIMPLTDIREAGEIAERLRMALAMDLPGGERLTVSLGVASCDDNTKSPLDFIQRADDALYQAKKQGKNRAVVIHPGASMTDKAGWPRSRPARGDTK